jgi:pyrimidine-nucleoside phosphorylase
MRMYDVIHHKRDGRELTREEIEFFVRGVTDGSIPDYQTTALLMAIYFRGLSSRETGDLTDCMAHSGDMVDLSPIDGVKVDKHSTGGVGDKTTLIVAPIVASCGVRVAKMSGRGLGHTGGTIDKLESIPGFCTSLSVERFFEVVRETGLSVVGQTGNLAPADKKLYALRDVTATVDNVGLIAASIMSKKLAAGADAIVLDVKTGSGAFMKTVDDSILLAQAMVSIGEHTGRRTVALITDMDRPLGHAVGNSLEVIEAVETLHGRGPADLTEVCMELAANMLFLGGKGSIDDCRALAREAIHSGRAFDALCRMTAAQGGDVSYLTDPDRFEKAAFMRAITAPSDGWLLSMDTEAIGIASVMLGAGRETKESPIDFAAGLHILAKPGDRVHRGDVLATLCTNREDSLDAAEKQILGALTFGPARPEDVPLIFARVTGNGVERFSL